MENSVDRFRAIDRFAGLGFSQSWEWRTRGGEMVLPRSMETRHLYYTLRMIWNNFMPADMRVGNFRPYAFGRFYTRKYLQEAIGNLGTELASRGDIRPAWMEELQQMAHNLAALRL